MENNKLRENKKTCRVCKGKYTPFNTMQQVCGVKCSLIHARGKEAKKRKAKHLAEKKAFKMQDKKLRAKEAQKAFNAYIRIRDDKEPCISCQRHHNGQYHAGHYKTAGAHPEIKYNEDNCHKQCAPCNNHLSANLVNYRVHLENKIGTAKLDQLESYHKPVKYTAEELYVIEQKYKLMKKELSDD